MDCAFQVRVAWSRVFYVLLHFNIRCKTRMDCAFQVRVAWSRVFYVLLRIYIRCKPRMVTRILRIVTLIHSYAALDIRHFVRCGAVVACSLDVLIFLLARYSPSLNQKFHSLKASLSPPPRDVSAGAPCSGTVTRGFRCGLEKTCLHNVTLLHNAAPPGVVVVYEITLELPRQNKEQDKRDV
ncbi:hypothetical protein EVAR_46712_1 [Eumeta japonica]|uniref:Uncharacterized protein n=1 Tax=Eumeta variegata TaxID=151549 RepID=A0A4C1XDK1_EUMVA|nr:hypothetical protein EVAR_46712_1 [Eumeta japonica]